MKKCSNCGRLEQDDTANHCEICGGILEPVNYGGGRNKGGSTGKILLAAVVVVVLAAAIVVVARSMLRKSGGSNGGTGGMQQVTVIPQNPDNSQPDYDYDCTNGVPIMLDGYVFNYDGSFYLELSDPVSMQVADANGNPVVYENQTELHLISQSPLSDYEGIEVKAYGDVRIDDSGSGLKMITSDILALEGGSDPETVTPAPTQKVTPAPTKKAKKQKKASSTQTAPSTADDSSYIFPDSNSRYLGESDVAGMSLQQINYAKNEIFARHGRKFKSSELQNYFNQKSWYSPSVEPDDFNIDYVKRVMNDYERKNMEFLAAKELAIDPNGYQPR